MSLPDIVPEPLGDGTPLAELTTMRVGGPAERILVARSADELVRHAIELWDEGEPWLLLGGGSNTVVCDEGFPGTVLLVRNTGIARVDDVESGERAAAESGLAESGAAESRAVERGAAERGTVRLRVQAGHDWDHLVATCVDRGWSGIEALSGIPGLAGAAPVQNIGAYGQELSDVLHSIEFLDRDSGEVRRMTAEDLQLGYRDSAIKRGLEGVVLSIDLVLFDQAGTYAGAAAGAASGPEQHGRHGASADTVGGAADPVGGAADPASGAADPASRTAALLGAEPRTDGSEPLSAPVRYAQLAGALGVEIGDRVPLRELRNSVLRLRASKGMVLDPEDHDTWSAGSFFTNPIVSERFSRELPGDAPRFPLQEDDSAPAITTFEELAAGVPLRVPQPATERSVKLSAAWLIEHAGISRGFRLPGSGAAISSKHTLAITNQGGATAADVAQLARFAVQRVQQEFGVILAPEPNLYGLEL